MRPITIGTQKCNIFQNMEKGGECGDDLRTHDFPCCDICHGMKVKEVGILADLDAILVEEVVCQWFNVERDLTQDKNNEKEDDCPQKHSYFNDAERISLCTFTARFGSRIQVKRQSHACDENVNKYVPQ